MSTFEYRISAHVNAAPSDEFLPPSRLKTGNFFFSEIPYNE
jgi:hypothetical protein